MGMRMRATHNGWGCGGPPEAAGSDAMHDRRPDRSSERRRHRRPRPGRSRKRDRELTPEERVLRAARRRANQRMRFLTHLVAYGFTILMLLFLAGFRPAFIVALCWGIGLASHYFGAMVAPNLRQRFIDREVEREVQRGVPEERRRVEGKNLRSLEELSASIAHEIRNPITAAKSLVQQMGEDPASGENVEYAKVALDELDRVERSVAHLLRYARDEDIRMSEVELSSVVESAIDTFRDRARAHDVEIVTELDTRSRLRGDSEKLRRVLINLVGNALDALEGAGVAKPRIEVMVGENLASTECWVRVRDNGPGIDPESLAKIFSPFYTSKQTGTGLGLALSKKVVDAHGGSIEATSSPGAGAEFTITIPKQTSGA
jgi:signal transduction histidine kinase